MKEPHFPRKKLIQVWKSADYGCPSFPQKSNFIDQHLQQNGWLLTDKFQQMLVIDRHFSRNVGHWQTFFCRATPNRVRTQNQWNNHTFQEKHSYRCETVQIMVVLHFCKNQPHWPTFAAKMLVIDRQISINVGHWQIFFKKCWSLTDIFQEMLANGVSEISRRLRALQGTAEPVRSQNQWNNHTFQWKKLIEVWNSADYGCPSFLQKSTSLTNIWSKNVGHWQTNFNKCWSLTDIIQEMLVIDRHFSRNVGQSLQRKYPTAYGATGHRATGENAKSMKQPHFASKTLIDVWNSADYGCPSYLHKSTSLTNIWSKNVGHWQTFFKKCWSLTDIFQEMLVIDRHFSRNVGQRGQRNLADSLWHYTAPPNRWERKINETTTLCKKKTHRGVKQCRLWLSFISAKINLIDQHLQQKCWSLTDKFQ